MKTQDLGGLSSDQKIGGVFEAFGYSIPVAKDGRRIWPTKFKREMVKRMRAGTLTVQEFQKECQVPDNMVYKWRKQFPETTASKARSKKAAFAEVRVEEIPKHHGSIELSWRGVELKLDGDFPIESLATLVRQLGTTR